MNGRFFQRVPTSIQVSFRKASSLLFAYSVNISRGGIFLATESNFSVGTSLEIEIEIPGVGATLIQGDVSWIKESTDESGPKGIGIKFATLDEKLSSFIDHLVSNFLEIQFLVFSPHASDAENIARMLRSIVSAADVVIKQNLAALKSSISDDCDLVFIDVDEDEELAWATMQWLKKHPCHVPMIALASTNELKTESMHCGAAATADNPPQFNNLRLAVVHTISKPMAITSKI